MTTSLFDKIINRNPSLYKALYNARNDIGIIFNEEGIPGYLQKQRYARKFKNSAIYLTVPLNDKRFHISIGKYSYSVNQVKVGYVPAKDKLYSIKIGNFTQISGNLTIIISKAHTLNSVSNSMNNLFLDRRGRDLYEKYHKEAYGNVEIGSDVWMGEGVTIIGGVKIGDGAVIGAKAVVTKNVPPYAVVAGVPAKVKKYRFSRKIIKQLLRIKWWNWDEKKILDNLEDFYDMKKFVKKYG